MARATGAATRRLLAGAAGAVLALLTFALLRAQTAPLNPQSQANLVFIRQESFAAALDRYPRVWPPLYPTWLWLCARLGLAPAYVNWILFDLVLLAVWMLSRRLAPRIHPLVPTSVMALAHFSYPTLYQIVSEPLFVLLALLALERLCAYASSPDRIRAAGVGAAVGAACLTRYIGLFWLLPIASIVLFRRAPPGRRERVAHFFPLAVGIAPVAVWMLAAWARTGHLTGADRVGRRPFQHLTDFSHNLTFTVKALAIDWFSPVRDAAPIAVRQPGWQGGEGIAIALGAVLLVACVGGWLASRSRERTPAAGSVWEQKLLATFTLSYPLVVIALWSLGNNDPIHSRFLFPLQPFLLLLAAQAWSSSPERARRGWWGLSMRLLLVQVAATQAWRCLGSVG